MRSQSLDPITSPLASLVKPVFLQEHAVAPMQYPGDANQVGRQITQIIVSNPDPDTVLQKIVRTLGEIFQADTCLIAADTSHQVTPQTAFWCADEYLTLPPEQQVQLLENLVQDDVVAFSEPLAIPDIQADETWSALEWHSHGLPIRSLLRIPTQFQGKPNGVIFIGRWQPYAWSNWEKELLKAVSEPVAIAISQIQMHQQVNHATQYQTLVTEMTTAIRGSFDLDQIIHMAIAGTAQALQVDRGFILLLKYSESALLKNSSLKRIPKAKVTVASEWLGGNVIPTSAESGQSEQQTNTLLNYSFCLSESYLCQQVFKDPPEPVVIADRQDLPLIDSTSENTTIFDFEAMPALLMVPLESQNTILGFLVLQHCQPHRWQPEELDLVNCVSAQASTAIIQSQTLRQVQLLVEERTAQLQSSLEVQAKLYEKTRQQIDQLRHLNQIKDEFLSTVSHELRTPLTSMALAIRMLRQTELPIERRTKYLDILEQQCNQEIKLINDLLALQQMESNNFSIQLQKIDLKKLIKDLAQSFEQKWVDKGLTITLDLPKRSLMLQTDPDSLNRILLELLTNAGKYSDPETIVHLRVTHQIEQQVEQIVLTISNTGSGISPTELTYIFDKFRRGQGVTQNAIQGTGLGLALVKCLVEHLNGTISTSSCPTDKTQACETCFTLTLPYFFDTH